MTKEEVIHLLSNIINTRKPLTDNGDISLVILSKSDLKALLYVIREFKEDISNDRLKKN